MANKDVSVDRSSDRPVRTDNRSVLHQLRDALNAHLPTDVNVNSDGKRQGLMDAVDEAVKGAPAPGSESN